MGTNVCQRFRDADTQGVGEGRNFECSKRVRALGNGMKLKEGKLSLALKKIPECEICQAMEHSLLDVTKAPTARVTEEEVILNTRKCLVGNVLH